MTSADGDGAPAAELVTGVGAVRMAPMTSRRGLQAVLRAISVVAAVAGSAVVQGGANVLDGGDLSANVDSEFRFYASWYAVFGVLLLGAAQRPESETVIVRACETGFGFAGASRLLSMKATGSPHVFFKILTVIEFVLPAVIIPWQSTVARKTRATSRLQLPRPLVRT